MHTRALIQIQKHFDGISPTGRKWLADWNRVASWDVNDYLKIHNNKVYPSVNNKRTCFSKMQSNRCGILRVKCIQPFIWWWWCFCITPHFLFQVGCGMGALGHKPCLFFFFTFLYLCKSFNIVIASFLIRRTITFFGLHKKSAPSSLKNMHLYYADIHIWIQAYVRVP